METNYKKFPKGDGKYLPPRSVSQFKLNGIRSFKSPAYNETDYTLLPQSKIM